MLLKILRCFQGKLSLRFSDRSSEDGFDDLAVNVGQPEVAAPVSEGQPRVIETEQMQNRCVEVVDVDFVFRDLHTIIISLAVGHPAADSCPGQPGRVGKTEMAAPVGCLPLLGCGRIQ